jgi:hypothetical protein
VIAVGDAFAMNGISTFGVVLAVRDSYVFARVQNAKILNDGHLYVTHDAVDQGKAILAGFEVPPGAPA